MSARDALRVALDPRSVAIIGASDDPDKIGGRPLSFLARFGYTGAVYPVNPNRREVQGRPAFPDIESLPAAPEVAIIAVPGRAAVEAVAQCAARTVKVAVVMSSGFSDGGAEGQQLEDEMCAAARAGGMRIVGPNTQGLANFGTGAILSFSTVIAERDPLRGPVALVSQSGGMSIVPARLLERRGIGIRHAHATGNDADVTAAELACVVAEDPEVRLLLVYLEKIGDAGQIAELGRLARERELPVLLLKGGATPPGQIASRSHTGALATEDALVDAFLERHGIWRAATTEELVRAAGLYLDRAVPRGRRLVVLSNSGATCVMAADAAARAGMPLAELAQGTQDRLAAVLPAFATVTNPIDITAALLSNSRLFSDVLPIIAADPAGDAVMVGIPVAGRGYDVDAFAIDTARFARETGKPIAVNAPLENVAERFRAEGLTVYDTETEAVEALNQLLAHADLARGAERAGQFERPRELTPGRALDEAQSLSLLARAGVPVVEHRFCATVEDAVAAAGAIGSPVALKGASPTLVHKSDVGAVLLDVAGEPSVSAAFSQVRAAVERAGHVFAGVVVEPMMVGRHELMLGARHDRTFGLVVLVGAGGRYVEALPDTAILLWPFDERDARAALGRLRLAPLFAGVRGERALDTSPLARAAVALGCLLADEPSIATVDVNPVLADEHGCVALDAVVTMAA